MARMANAFLHRFACLLRSAQSLFTRNHTQSSTQLPPQPQPQPQSNMQTFTTVASLREFLATLSTGPGASSHSSVGFVPTMGNLHAGHATLVREALKHHTHTVVSVFVNPSQFAPGEDLATYPRTLPEDTALLQQLGVTALFAPTAEEIYPQGGPTKGTFVELDLPPCTDTLEARTRPQFFRGVATVVCKLLNIVQPHTAYFGQKDWQQLCVVRQLCRGLFLNVEIASVPIVRDSNGLALSSRNGYLSPEQRLTAAAIHSGLVKGRDIVNAGRDDPVTVNAVFRAVLSEWEQEAPGAFRVDYLAVCCRDTLAPLEVIKGPCIILCAVYYAGVRLIDNELA